MVALVHPEIDYDQSFRSLTQTLFYYEYRALASRVSKLHSLERIVQLVTVGLLLEASQGFLRQDVFALALFPVLLKFAFEVTLTRQREPCMLIHILFIEVINCSGISRRFCPSIETVYSFRLDYLLASCFRASRSLPIFGFRDPYVGDSGGIVPQCGSVLKGANSGPSCTR